LLNGHNFDHLVGFRLLACNQAAGLQLATISCPVHP
jgi:hypothetical protein